MDHQTNCVLTIGPKAPGESIADQIAAGFNPAKDFASLFKPIAARFASWKRRLLRYRGCNTWSKLELFFREFGIELNEQYTTDESFLELLTQIRTMLVNVSKLSTASLDIEQQKNRDDAKLKGRLEFCNSRVPPRLALEYRPQISPNAPAL